MASPVRWRVLWGTWLRPGFAQEIVWAFDRDEAMSIAAERHPDRFRPLLAFPVGEAIGERDR